MKKFSLPEFQCLVTQWWTNHSSDFIKKNPVKCLVAQNQIVSKHIAKLVEDGFDKKDLKTVIFDDLVLTLQNVAIISGILGIDLNDIFDAALPAEEENKND